MKILSINVLKWDQENPLFLSSAYELGFINWLQRHFFKETLNFGIRTAVARVPVGERTVISMEEANAVCCVIVDNRNVACVVVCDEEYPQKACFTIISQMYREFYKTYNLMEIDSQTKDTQMPVQRFEEMIRAYQDPKEADKLLKLEHTLSEVQDIVHKTLNDLLRRGETLDNLVAKSKDMSGISQDFYKKAKQTNKRCCVLI